MACVKCIFDSNSTNSHSEYVIYFAFPAQQWLLKCASIWRYTYIVCLFIYVNISFILERVGLKPVKVTIFDLLDLSHLTYSTFSLASLFYAGASDLSEKCYMHKTKLWVGKTVGSINLCSYTYVPCVSYRNKIICIIIVTG